MVLSLSEYKVEFLRGLADNTRLKIVEALKEQEKTVSELVETVGSSQANISTHLKLLKTTGIVKSRSKGKYMYYSLRGEAICEFLNSLEEMLILMRKKAFEGA